MYDQSHFERAIVWLHTIHMNIILYAYPQYIKALNQYLYIYKMKALEIYIHILSGMKFLIFGINNKAIPIYKREFIIWLGLIYDYTWVVLLEETVYSTVEYYVQAISTVFYTLHICVHTFEHGIFIDYSHNKNSSKKVSTMT